MFLGEFICPKGVLTGPSASEPWGSPWSSEPVQGGGGVTGAVTPARVVSALVPFLDSELKKQRVFSLGNDLSSILCRCCSFC